MRGGKGREGSGTRRGRKQRERELTRRASPSLNVSFVHSLLSSRVASLQANLITYISSQGEEPSQLLRQTSQNRGDLMNATASEPTSRCALRQRRRTMWWNEGASQGG